jgi:hypothetical protein
VRALVRETPDDRLDAVHSAVIAKPPIILPDSFTRSFSLIRPPPPSKMVVGDPDSTGLTDTSASSLLPSADSAVNVNTYVVLTLRVKGDIVIVGVYKAPNSNIPQSAPKSTEIEPIAHVHV